MHGRNNNGKKMMTVRIVNHAFEIIHLLIDNNPLHEMPWRTEVLVRMQHVLDLPGVVRRQADDVSLLRHVNQYIALITTGARNSSFQNIKLVSKCPADEINNETKKWSHCHEFVSDSFITLSIGTVMSSWTDTYIVFFLNVNIKLDEQLCMFFFVRLHHDFNSMLRFVCWAVVSDNFIHECKVEFWLRCTFTFAS